MRIGNDLHKARGLIIALAERDDVAIIDSVEHVGGHSFARVEFFRPDSDKAVVVCHYGPGVTTIRRRLGPDPEQLGRPEPVRGWIGDYVRVGLYWLTGTRGEVPREQD